MHRQLARRVRVQAGEQHHPPATDATCRVLHDRRPGAASLELLAHQHLVPGRLVEVVVEDRRERAVAGDAGSEAHLLQRLQLDRVHVGEMGRELIVDVVRRHGVDLPGLGGTVRLMTAHATPTLTSLASGAGCGCKLAAADILPLVSGLPVTEDPRLLVGSVTSDDAAVLQLARRPRPRADRRLLHPARRRPVRLRAHRRGQRALRRLRDGRHAGERAEPRRLPARAARPRRAARDPARRARRRDGGRRAGRRRSLDRRRRAQVRPRRDRAGRSGADDDERGRAPGRRARPDEAAGRRRHRHRPQARRRRRRRSSPRRSRR